MKKRFSPLQEKQAILGLDDENPFVKIDKGEITEVIATHPTIGSFSLKPHAFYEVSDKARADLSMINKVLGITEIILGDIVSKSNSYRIVTFRSKDPNKKSFSHLAKTKELKQYEKDFAVQCRIYRNLNLSEPFKLVADIYYPNRRKDLDGAAKCLLDSLQEAGAITNDNLLEELILRRHIDAKNPRVEFVITRANG